MLAGKMILIGLARIKIAKLKFTSLKILLFEKNYSFTDVWHIVAYEDVF